MLQEANRDHSYLKPDRTDNTSMQEDFFEYLAKTLDDHYVCFYHYPMAPSTVSGHTLFKFEVSGASS